jgi:sulfate transport system substrate-binding protein
VPHPKNTGNGRNTYLSAWAWALKQPGGNGPEGAGVRRQAVKNAPCSLPACAMRRRPSCSASWATCWSPLNRRPNDRQGIRQGQFEVVYPSLTLQTEFPVAVVEKVVDKKGTRAQATAYLEYLWSREGQENAAQNYLRPRDPDLLKKYAAFFPPVKTFTVDEVFGGANKAFVTHFKDGGSFDRIYVQK